MNVEQEVDTAFAMVLRAMDRLDVGFDLQIFMMSSMSDDGTVHVRYSAPRAGANATASELMRDFSSAIIDHHVALAARESSLEQ